jgi:hypothetical protein
VALKSYKKKVYEVAQAHYRGSIILRTDARTRGPASLTLVKLAFVVVVIVSQP